ncbi:MAG: hypothetical protein SNJ52_02130 [Verrucomicrobiia bacterium]
MNADTRQLLNRYWSNFLGTTVGDGGAEVEFVWHTGLEGYNGIFIFQVDKRTVVSAPPDRLRSLLLRFSDTRALRRMDAERIYSTLGKIAVRVTGPTTLNYVDASSLRTLPGPEARPLNDADLPALQKLLENEDGAEVETCGIGNVRGELFGLFDGANLVSVAGYDIWGGVIGNLAALTAKSQRKNGYGLGTIQTAARHGTKKGLIMQYRVKSDHDVALHLSRRLGFTEFAKSLTIDLVKPKE